MSHKPSADDIRRACQELLVASENASLDTKLSDFDMAAACLHGLLSRRLSELRLLHSDRARDESLSPIDVKLALVKRGTTMEGWAKANGFKPSTVWRAVHCDIHGKLSRLIRANLRVALGL